MISIGIDTGGTYTDAVAFEHDTGEVLAKGKAPTTRENLAIGIMEAVTCLPLDLLHSAQTVALSTTLATNACVENKGGRAKLVLVGTTSDVLQRIGAGDKFGLANNTVLCVDSNGSFDGRDIDEPDWADIAVDNEDWFSDAEALSVAEVYAINNGAVIEKNAKSVFADRFGIPVVAASELVSGLNVMERGATALLNARLLPVIQEFINAVEQSMDELGIKARSLAVRSDGSLMSRSLALSRPVETIVSGPAASVLGGHRLVKNENCLIVDMGGTTTDISIIKYGSPKMATDGIRIGTWSTQIKGVYVDTFALGGDSALRIEEGELKLSNRRVLPICFAASKWPSIKSDLRTLLANKTECYRDFHEFLYLVKQPKDLSRYSENEIKLINILSDTPRVIEYINSEEGVDKYRLDSERLEAEGIVMRCGLTPTDMMHIKGDYKLFDREASVLIAEFFTRVLRNAPVIRNVTGKTIDEFAEYTYDLVSKKLYDNIVRILLADRFPKAFDNGVDPQVEMIISDSWNRQSPGQLLELGFTTPAALVGVGAPIHVFLPRVAAVLGAECVIPEHAEVANAIGAVSADITASVRVEIRPIMKGGGLSGYTVHSPEKMYNVKTMSEAEKVALESARESAITEARKRGALGELQVEVSLDSQKATSKDGESVSFGYHAFATATDRLT